MTNTDDATVRRLLIENVTRRLWGDATPHVSWQQAIAAGVDLDVAALRAAGHLRTPGTVEVVREAVKMAIDNGLDEASDGSVSMTLAAQLMRPTIHKWVDAALAAGADVLKGERIVSDTDDAAIRECIGTALGDNHGYEYDPSDGSQIILHNDIEAIIAALRAAGHLRTTDTIEVSREQMGLASIYFGNCAMMRMEPRWDDFVSALAAGADDGEGT